MSLKLSRFVFLTLILVIAATFTSTALGQLNNDPTVEIGMKPYGSFEGGSIDSISTTNGNLNLHIPLVSYPQIGRKLHLGFDVTLSNGNYQYTPNTVPACTQQPNVCEYGTFDNGSFVRIVPDFGLTADVSGVIPPVSGPYASITTPDGSLHEVGATSTGWRSNDASGFLCLNNCATVVDRDGIRYDITSSSGGQSQKIYDLNGNFYTAITNANGAITGYTDTLGRTIPLPPVLGGLSGFTYTSDTSGCTGALTASSAYLWNLPGYQGGQMQFKICYATVYFGAETCFKSGGTLTCGVTLQHVAAIQSILLPNNTSWTFTYNSANPNVQGSTATGNLLQITFPTGGYIKYSYGGVYMCQVPSSTTTTTYTYAVATRTINSNDGTGEHTWNYSFVSNTGLLSGSTPFTTNSVDPLNQKTVHTISALGGVCAYYETQTQNYDVSGNLLKTLITDYHADLDYLAGSSNPIKTSSNVFPIRVTTTWANGQTSKVETDPDLGVAMTGTPSGYALLYGMPIARREYDYFGGSPGALLRQTKTQYQWQSNSNYLTANLLDRISSTTILNGSAQVAQTSYGFDENNGSPQGVFGNQTSVTRWFNGGTSPKAQTVYNAQGMPIKTIDAKLNTTQITYDGTGLFPSQIQYPTTANGVAHIEKFTYDANIGKMTSHTDQNSQPTTLGYDTMARLTSVTYPSGGGSETYQYNDSVPASFTFTKTINASTNLVKVVNVDGLARPIQTALTSDPDGTTYNATVYDQLGRISQVYNPTRCNPPTSNCGESTWGVTSSLYDALGRTTQVTRPDGNTVLTTYTGRATQVQDEGNGTQRVTRISQNDGLGRLVSVCEVSSATLLGNGGTPVACGQDIAGTGFLTSYQYDALDNLFQVSQPGTSLRQFSYDSLSRITSATNPESGTICYGTVLAGVCQANGYDLNGNLVTKTDARGITTTFGYDALNRLLTKTYSDTTPGVTNTYDIAVDGLSVTYPVGRLTKSATNDGKTATVNSYDQMGRAQNQFQCTPQNCGVGYFSLPYGYDFAGDITSAGNGMGTTISYGFNGAAALNGVTSTLSDANHPATLLSGVHYNAPGAITSASFGNGASEIFGYDPRVRITSAATNGFAAPSGSTGSGTVSGSEQSIVGAPATAGTGAVTFSGILQSKQVQTQAAVAGSGSVTFSGALQSKQVQTQAATSGTGSVTISGAERTKIINPCAPVRNCPTTVYDTGTVSIIVNGVTSSVNYGQGSTSSTIASGLASAINANSNINSLVSASASSATVTITARQTGPQTNYSLSAGSVTTFTTYFSGTSFPATASGSTLTGGSNATYTTVYDSGTSTITVNGHSDSVSWSGSGTTSSSIASALATNINADSSASASASASGSTVNLTAKTAGASTNYSLASSWTFDSTDFSGSSFTISNSGSTLVGGRDAAYTTVYDSGSSTITVNSHSNTISWSGSSTTTSSIASALASNINADSAASVTASVSGSIVSLTAKTTGASTNYSLSSSSTYDSSNFSSASFSSANSGSTLTGGHDTGATTYDSGSVWITVNGTQYSVSYGQGSTATSLASSLAQAINGNSGSPVTATASSTTVNLASKGTGSSTNYSLAVGSSTSQSSSFSQPSFTVAASGGAMTGGANGAPTTLYSLSLGYAPDSNVTSANDSVNGNWVYGYDPFNRVVSANQNSGQSVYSYVYDNSGNRWQQNGPHTMMLTFTGNATTNNNRADGYSYDLAGNLLNDGTNALTFDAENRIITAYNVGSGTSSYLYDANGRRVRKTIGASSVDFLYDLNGNQITEISSTGVWNRGEIYAGGRHLATYNNGTTYFTHADWLGTERVRSDVKGVVYETCTSIVFGDALACSNSDASPMHFTGKERDFESGLDNFGARYNSSSMGRFMSPDWSATPQPVPYAKLGNPQSLNLYSYVQNNPVTNLDADGHFCLWGLGTTCDQPPPPPPPPPSPPNANTTVANFFRFGNLLSAAGAVGNAVQNVKDTVQVTTSTQVGIVQVDSDGKKSYVLPPATAVNLNVTVNGPKPDQNVIVEPSVAVGKFAGVGTSIVQDPGGSIHSQGGSVSVGLSWPPYPASVSRPIRDNEENWKILVQPLPF